MIKARRLAALLPLLCLALIPSGAQAMQLDAGVRAVIFTDDYKLGWGGEVGGVVKATTAWDMGLHLNYTHFTSKVPETVDDAEEIGGYVTAYWNPTIDQGFNLRLGPHVGYANLDGHNLDLGADVMALFKIAPKWHFYGVVVPSVMLGSEAEALFRIGFGLEYRACN